MSIITGFIIRPVVVKNTQQDHAVLKLKSVARDYSNRKFLIPFKHSKPGDLQSFSCFIGKYLEAIDAPFSDLFGFYHKINRAWQSNIENSSLSLGVAIEGIMKSYFWELGLPDDEIRQQADEPIEKLDNVAFGERIKGWLLSGINGLLNNSSSKGALYQMVKDGLLSEKMADEWVKLRNRSVHPDRLNEDRQSFQKYLDQIYCCIALFYRLLFVIIRYEGSYVDYSEEGWPDKRFPQQAE